LLYLGLLPSPRARLRLTAPARLRPPALLSSYCSARPGTPCGSGPDPSTLLTLRAPGHPSWFRPGASNLDHPPRARAALMVPARTISTLLTHRALGRFTSSPGPDQGLLQLAPAPRPPGQARRSRCLSPPSAVPIRLTRMRIQVPIMIVPAGDLRPKAIGRSQVSEYDGSAPSPLTAQQGRELHTTAPAVCILERHPTTAILPSYRRTSWVRSPRQQHASPHVRGCWDSTTLTFKSRDTQEGASC
jgi:hypothetical protein